MDRSLRSVRESRSSPAFRGIYPGVLRDLELTDEEVEAFIAENREALEKAARARPDEG
jgi:hypothetical protein